MHTFARILSVVDYTSCSINYIACLAEKFDRRQTLTLSRNNPLLLASRSVKPRINIREDVRRVLRRTKYSPKHSVRPRLRFVSDRLEHIVPQEIGTCENKKEARVWVFAHSFALSRRFRERTLLRISRLAVNRRDVFIMTLVDIV